MRNVIMQYLNYFLSYYAVFELLFVMINQKLDFGFSGSLFTIKIDVFPLLQAFILTVVFFHESNH